MKQQTLGNNREVRNITISIATDHCDMKYESWTFKNSLRTFRMFARVFCMY